MFKKNGASYAIVSLESWRNCLRSQQMVILMKNKSRLLPGRIGNACHFYWSQSPFSWRKIYKPRAMVRMKGVLRRMHKSTYFIVSLKFDYFPVMMNWKYRRKNTVEGEARVFVEICLPLERQAMSFRQWKSHRFWTNLPMICWWAACLQDFQIRILLYSLFMF